MNYSTIEGCIRQTLDIPIKKINKVVENETKRHDRRSKKRVDASRNTIRRGR